MKIDYVKRFEQRNNIELPKDDGAENGVIGTLLCHPEYLYKTEYLKPNQFYSREYGCIYHVIKTLLDKGVTNIDNFIISTEIESNSGYKNIVKEAIGDTTKLNNWLNKLKLVSRDDVEGYEHLAESIITSAFKRDAYIKLNEMGNKVLDSKNNINEINYNVQTEVVKFANDYIINTDIQPIGIKAKKIWESIKNKRTEGGFSGLPSKFIDLNKYFTYENGELVVIGGRAKSGKSMFFLNEAIHKVENGVPTAIFDTEMSEERWLIRFLSLKSGVDIAIVKNGGTYEEEKRIEEAVQWLEDKPLVHLYDPEWTKDKIYMTAKSLHQAIGLGFLIFDYIKVNDTTGIDSKEHNMLGDMTNFLKNKIAGALDIPVLAGGQMSPREQRLADSDKINRYASTIAYWIHKTKEEMVNDGKDGGNCKLVIGYNRNGSMTEEDEYLNFEFDGNKANIKQAKNFYKIEGALPY